MTEKHSFFGNPSGLHLAIGAAMAATALALSCGGCTPKVEKNPPVEQKTPKQETITAGTSTYNVEKREDVELYCSTNDPYECYDTSGLRRASRTMVEHCRDNHPMSQLFDNDGDTGLDRTVMTGFALHVYKGDSNSPQVWRFEKVGIGTMNCFGPLPPLGRGQTPDIIVGNTETGEYHAFTNDGLGNYKLSF